MIMQSRRKPIPQDLVPAQRLIASGGPVTLPDAVRSISKATVQVRRIDFVFKWESHKTCMIFLNFQKPEQTMALLELFTNFFLAMAATKQNETMRDHCQRMMTETLEGVSQLYGTQYIKHAPPQQMRPIDINAYRTMLMKLRAERQVSQPESNPGQPNLTCPFFRSKRIRAKRGPWENWRPPKGQERRRHRSNWWRSSTTWAGACK